MFILKALYFALPMYAANMAPVLMKWLPILDSPMDGGKTWKGKPILGANKTWRGFVMAIVFSLIAIYLQKLFMDNTAGINIIDYSGREIWLLGFLMGSGAIIGDAVKSFFKRRKDKPPGSRWFPFDQIDFVIGGLLFSSVVFFSGWINVLVILVLTPVLHLLVNYAAYKLRIKNVPW